MTVSTNDPSGRTLQVTLTPEQTTSGAGIRLKAVPSEAAGVAAMSDSFSSSPSEAFHGFGGRHNALDEHGQEFFNWLDQENEPAEPDQPSDPDLYPDGPEAAYYIQSSFVSNQGYGFDLETGALSRWSLDASHPESWQVQAAEPALEYLVAPGDLKQAAAEISAVTGRQPAPPRWALGPMLDREVEEPTESAAAYQASVEADLARFAAGRFPISAYRIEGWGFLAPEFLARSIEKLRELKIKPLLYFRPFVGKRADRDRKARRILIGDRARIRDDQRLGSALHLRRQLRCERRSHRPHKAGRRRVVETADRLGAGSGRRRLHARLWRAGSPRECTSATG